MTKHANALLSARPPAKPYVHVKPQTEVDALPQRAIAAATELAGPIESFTVIFERDGMPSRAVVSCLRPDGSCALSSSTEPEAIGSLLKDEIATADHAGDRGGQAARLGF
jgi:acetyl-CoA C-acetyltransferase